MSRSLSLVTMLLATVAASCSWDGTYQPSEPSPAERIARGRYLVEGVGMCADCHTPRGADGQLVMTEWLAGATLEFQPLHPMPVWAPVAPPVAGLPGRTDEQALALLERGAFPDGTQLRPPMPAYRFNHEDARAVVAYLRSLAK